MKNIMQMMQKAQELQKNMGKLQEEIKAMEFVSSSGGGLVSITMNGAYEIKNIAIDDSIVSVDEKSLLTDLIIAAYSDCKRKVKEETDAKMQEITAGLPIPPGFKIPGLF